MGFGGLMDGYYSLGDDINKIHAGANGETSEGVVSDFLDELKLNTPDEDLITLKTKWETAWGPYSKEIDAQQKENEQYWKGNQYPGMNYRPTERPLTDNLIFEALETFLPLATKQNPEPMVEGDGTDQGTEDAGVMQKYLVHLAEKIALKRKIKRVARYWALYFIGIAKVGWSEEENEITLMIPRPQKIILDPEASVNDDMEYEGSYIGEYRKDTAQYLLDKFAKKNVDFDESVPTEGNLNPDEAYDDDLYKFIHNECHGKLATELQYQEWWTNEYVFWTLKKQVLGKYKNPHWNYKGQMQTIITPDGQPQQMEAKPKNHFKSPKMPYIFLSIFNLGQHPHDDTTLVQQNLSKQDVINKRQRQIDKNVDWMNGGWAISGERSGLTRDEATSAVDAARKGGGMWIPQGDVNSAVVRLTGTGLPADLFNNLQDMRSETRNSFGISGTSPQSISTDPTVGGKILVRTADGDRIGGGISEYLEGFASKFFNWAIQFIYVYYDEPHKATLVGDAMAQEQISVDNTISEDLNVSVKQGSLIPKDSLTQMNQAIDLAEAQLLDPLTLFEKMQFTNPQESAGRLMLFHAAPQAYIAKYFPDLQQLMPPPSPPPPKESISTKDLPPEGVVQQAAKVGIQISPEQVAVHQVALEALKHIGKKQAARELPQKTILDQNA